MLKLRQGGREHDILNGFHLVFCSGKAKAVDMLP
jgi:hypothetical protein